MSDCVALSAASFWMPLERKLLVCLKRATLSRSALEGETRQVSHSPRLPRPLNIMKTIGFDLAIMLVLNLLVKKQWCFGIQPIRFIGGPPES